MSTTTPVSPQAGANLVTLEIDGKTYYAPKGAMVIQVADEHGIVIPRFCYHKELPIAANCRMCLVEVEKVAKPLPACATPVAEGMKVHTHSPKAIAAQRGVVEFLLINLPLDCPVCDQGGECPLQDQAMGFGKGISRFYEGKRSVTDKHIGPLVATAMTRCIHCTRCIRFLDVVAGLHELGAVGRGERLEITNYVEKSLTSELSGNIIDLCPVGALLSKPYRHTARPWELVAVSGVAPHDSVGSNIDLHVRYGRQVMRVLPRENPAINNIWLSDRDRFSYEGIYSEDRLQAPLIKRDGAWHETDWQTALEFTAQRLQQLVSHHGPGQLGALVAPNATLEEMYLAQKLMRALGSPHIDHRLRQGDFSDQDRAPVFPWLGQRLTDLENVEAALLIGSNVRKEQPLLAYRLRRAALRGSRIMFLNPVDYAQHFPVAEKLVVSPTGMLRALAGIARTLADLSGKEAPPGLERLATGIVPEESQQAIARHLHAAGPKATVLLGNLALAHPQLSLLRALAAAVAGLSGASLGYLPESANSAGAWLAGALPHRAPGGRPASAMGFDVRTMLEAGLRGYLLLGLEPELDGWDPAAATRALQGAEFVLSLSSYRTPAMEAYADVLLPMAAFAETSGTYVNAEGRWQSFSGAVAPPGESRPAWKLLRVLGNLLNLPGFEYNSSEEVREELRGLCQGITPDNTVSTPLPDTLPQASEALVRIADVPMYATDPVVRRAKSLQMTPEAAAAAVHLNEALATALGLVGRDSVSVAQGEGSVVLPLVLDARVPDHCVLIPAGLAGSAALGPAFGELSMEDVAVLARPSAVAEAPAVSPAASGAVAAEPSVSERQQGDTLPRHAQPEGAPSTEVAAAEPEAVGEVVAAEARIAASELTPPAAAKPEVSSRASGRRSSSRKGGGAGVKEAAKDSGVVEAPVSGPGLAPAGSSEPEARPASGKGSRRSGPKKSAQAKDP